MASPISIAAVAVRTPTLGATLELLKPITWFAPMWAYGCGLVSVGGASIDRWPYALAGILLAGPLVCGTSQAINDWFDRDVDAINEPNRVIPSGRMPGRWGLGVAIAGTLLSALVGAMLGLVVFLATLVGLALAWAYSAPPFRLKRNGWMGNSAVGLCYEGLPWFTAAAAVAGGVPAWPVVAMALLYSIGAHGIMTLNDFKAVGGDRVSGIDSLPVLLGEGLAARVACAVMAAPQVVVIGLLASWGFGWHAVAVALLLLLQAACMVRLLSDPERHAAWYNATGTTFYVLGMLAAAFALQAMG